MKKFMTDIRTLAALLMAGAAMTACSSDDNIIEEQPVNPAQKTYTLTVNASKGEGSATRALTPDGKTFTASWATTENVYVKKDSDWATGTLKPQADGTTATLKGELSGIDIEASNTLTLQFPKSGDITYDGQQGTITDIQENFDWATATVTVASISSTGNINPTEPTTTFENQQAIIKFTLKDKGNSDAAISPSALTVTDGTSTVELTAITEATYTANGAGVLYVAFPAAGEGKTINLTASVGSDTYTYETSSTKTFTNGQYYEITVKMTKQDAVTDLSKVDCAGNARSTMSTANCYMVHTAGDYKLPLVYGNAIKNGVDNTTAYNPGGTGSDTYCANFVNHAGVNITSPWIKDNKDATDNNITVTTAELLWQDAQGLITAVGIDGNYLTLTVDKDATEQEGNAVIAAKDGDGNIVWSWHIWVTKQTFATLTTVNTGSQTYQVTPVNLGWVGEVVSRGYQTYYQWGRKDAFIPNTGVPNQGDKNHKVYNIDNTEVTGITRSNETVGIADNIKNPMTLYNVGSMRPCSEAYYNMWDAQQTSNGNIATHTMKTVYDPCPAGFCVPTSNLYYYMKNGDVSFAWDGTNKGRTLSSVYPQVFFPATGNRSNSSGSLGNVGYNGYYWSASATSASNYNSGHGLSLNESSVSYMSALRALGNSVRAVAEE